MLNILVNSSVAHMLMQLLFFAFFSDIPSYRLLCSTTRNSSKENNSNIQQVQFVVNRKKIKIP